MNLINIELGKKAIIFSLDYNNLPVKFISVGFIQGSIIEVIYRNFFLGVLCIKLDDRYFMIRYKTCDYIKISQIND